MTQSESHETFMRRALELAKLATGATRPNPLVGAVIVKDGHVVGDGFHARAGGPHAEVEALKTAGDAARGATMYVTLEPCNHHGRTPPCTRAILEAGIERVYFATRDPNPKVEGRGAEVLQNNGVDCIHGPLSEEAFEVNRGFFHWIRTGSPWIIAKFAAGLDGRIATRTHESKWITGPEARERGHELRREVDAILVGSGTILADNPQLTVRLPAREQPGAAGKRQTANSKQQTANSEQHRANSEVDGSLSSRTPDLEPSCLRIVLDSRGRSPIQSKVFADTEQTPTLVATTETSSPRWRSVLQDKGVDVLLVPPTDDGRIELSDLLEELGRREIRSVLVEGGATVHGSFFDQRLVDEVWAFLAPIVIGGTEAPGAVGGSGVATISNAFRLGSVRIEQLGNDLLVRGVAPDPRPALTDWAREALGSADEPILNS